MRLTVFFGMLVVAAVVVTVAFVAVFVTAILIAAVFVFLVVCFVLVVVLFVFHNALLFINSYFLRKTFCRRQI